MSTVPYVDEEVTSTNVPAGARLVVALSCADPLRRVADWAGQAIDLTGVTEVVMGRSDDGFQLTRAAHKTGVILVCRIPDVHMSSAHLHLADASGSWQVHDVDSMNGVWVNGERMTEAALQDGDVIEAGMTILLFREPSEVPPRAAEAAGTGPMEPELETLNPQLAKVVATARRLASSDLSLLVHGETGVGKEVLARAIHRMSGREGPFVAVNCSALPEALIASELFGVEKGAYSGAHKRRSGLIRSAHRGTLFLDEVAELPTACQPVLLRVLQEGQVTPVGGSKALEVDVRVLAATHQDLEARVERGDFRQDLLARLRGYTLRVPPLRDRREDIGLLIARLLPTCAGARAENIRLSRRAGGRLLLYDWPENVRELDKALRASALLCDDGTIRLEHLPERVRTQGQIRSFEDIQALLQRHKGNVSAMARALQTSRSQVRRLLERYGIE